MTQQPPYYILFAHSSISSLNPGAPSNTLGHPIIQYHFADDSPLALLPQHPNEHVLVLDYDPTTTNPPLVRSMSSELAVTSLKIEEAPGAAATEDSLNDKMYIIDTVESDSIGDILQGDRKSAHNILMQFKRRNATLRRALLSPDKATPSDTTSHPQALPGSSVRPDL